MALIDKLTAIADAIRGKTGKTEPLTLDQMPLEIVGIQAGGGGVDQSAGLVDGTLTEFVNAEVTTIRSYAFYFHSNLKKVVLPNSTGSCQPNAFRYCVALEIFDAPCRSLQGASFANCPALKTLVLRKTDSICTLESNNILNGTPFVSGTGGTVYVPSALIESYKKATNWSTLYAAGTCNFVAIEGSEYE